jgi:hypothetical protein
MPSAPGYVPKIGVERAVLLHDHDHVLDAVNVGAHACPGTYVGGKGGHGGGDSEGGKSPDLACPSHAHEGSSRPVERGLTEG